MIGDQIRTFRQAGLSYLEISELTGRAKSTINYHLSARSKQNTYNRLQIDRQNNPLRHKIYRFRRKQSKTLLPIQYPVRKQIREKFRGFWRRIGSKVMQCRPTFTEHDFILKHGDDPRCYLTGRTVDLTDPRSYALDHIIPASRGGPNTLNNCGLTIPEANRMKHDMDLNEFLAMCQEILSHHGYQVNPPTL